MISGGDSSCGSVVGVFLLVIIVTVPYSNPNSNLTQPTLTLILSTQPRWGWCRWGGVPVGDL